MAKYCFGVDLGGTTVKLGFFSNDGKILDKWEIPTRKENDGGYILSDISVSIKQKMVDAGIDPKDVAGVGIGVPGPVTADGIVKQCVNLGWGEFNVEDAFTALVGLPVKAANDANVAALGEQWQGGGKGYQDLVMVTLGTGVGGGLIQEGKIVSGSQGAAGEIGHMNVVSKEDTIGVCGCGNSGCLEQVASATGIVKLAVRELQENKMDSVLRNLETVTAKDVLDAAKADDALAENVIDTMASYLGTSLALISAVVNPEIIVIGGGVSKAGIYLINVIQKYFLEKAFHVDRTTKFALATLGNDAGIVGAAKMILDITK